MITLEHHPRAVEGEVLPPLPWHEGALEPHVVKVWWVVQTISFRVQFEDGGIWDLPDQQLMTMDRSDVPANVGEIFARWPQRFRFVRRVPGRYAGRT